MNRPTKQEIDDWHEECAAMSADIRALCAELVADLEEWVEGYLINDPPNEHTAASFERIDRARAALEVPDPGKQHVSQPYKLPEVGEMTPLVPSAFESATTSCEHQPRAQPVSLRFVPFSGSTDADRLES